MPDSIPPTRESARSALFVSDSRRISADRSAIFDVLADPAMHPVIDGSASVHALRGGSPARLSLGATFGMDMQLGARFRLRYKVVNTVVEFDEPTVIAWRHFNGHIWRYRLEEAGDATMVTEEWDARPAKSKLLLRLTRVSRRNQRAITRTLRNLEQLLQR